MKWLKRLRAERDEPEVLALMEQFRRSALSVDEADPDLTYDRDRPERYRALCDEAKRRLN